MGRSSRETKRIVKYTGKEDELRLVYVRRKEQERKPKATVLESREHLF